MLSKLSAMESTQKTNTVTMVSKIQRGGIIWSSYEQHEDEAARNTINATRRAGVYFPFGSAISGTTYKLARGEHTKKVPLTSLEQK